MASDNESKGQFHEAVRDHAGNFEISIPQREALAHLLKLADQAHFELFPVNPELAQELRNSIKNSKQLFGVSE